MVDFRIVFQLVEFILCIHYGAVVLTVIPECTEAIVFHLRIATVAHVNAREQIQSLKSVIAYALLVVIVISITLIRFRI